jgi:hypothetical protein
MKIAPLPFLSDSDTRNVAVPFADKNPKKVGLPDCLKDAHLMTLRATDARNTKLY